MESEKLIKQMIGIQKAAFNHTVDIAMAFRDQSEKIACSWCEKNGIFPEQSKKVMLEWGHVAKQSLEDYKKVINDGFNTMETCCNFPKTLFQSQPKPVEEKTMENRQKENSGVVVDEKQ